MPLRFSQSLNAWDRPLGMAELRRPRLGLRRRTVALDFGFLLGMIGYGRGAPQRVGGYGRGPGTAGSSEGGWVWSAGSPRGYTARAACYNNNNKRRSPVPCVGCVTTPNCLRACQVAQSPVMADSSGRSRQLRSGSSTAPTEAWAFNSFASSAASGPSTAPLGPSSEGASLAAFHDCTARQAAAGSDGIAFLRMPHV